MNQEKIAPPAVDISRMPDDPFGKISFADLIHGGNYKAYSGNRDAALHELLGVDYEFAHSSGLINQFYFDPKTGQDGLMHVLGGRILRGSR